MRSDKCKKGGVDRFLSFLLFAPPMGGQIWGILVPIFGDLGAFLGHILLHVGTFRSMLGLS